MDYSLKLEVSTLTPGPIVVVTATDLKYVPLAEAGFALVNTSCKVLKFSTSLSVSNDVLPIDA